MNILESLREWAGTAFIIHFRPCVGLRFVKKVSDCWPHSPFPCPAIQSQLHACKRCWMDKHSRVQNLCGSSRKWMTVTSSSRLRDNTRAAVMRGGWTLLLSYRPGLWPSVWDAGICGLFTRAGRLGGDKRWDEFISDNYIHQLECQMYVSDNTCNIPRLLFWNLNMRALAGWIDL